MRTTIDLDADVDARMRALARRRGVPLRVVINEALRASLHPAGSAASAPYVLPTRRLGIRAGIDVDKARILADDLEDDEIAHKLELRK
jgi:hypothetical protein